MAELVNWILWCIKLHAIVNKCAGLVSHRELTDAEKEYPCIMDIDRQ